MLHNKNTVVRTFLCYVALICFLYLRKWQWFNSTKQGDISFIGVFSLDTVILQNPPTKVYDCFVTEPPKKVGAYRPPQARLVP